MTARRVMAFGAAGLVAYIVWTLWPSEVRRVRGRLDALAAVINERPEGGIGQIARTGQLARFLTEDVVLEPGRGAGAIHGRERLLALASTAPGTRKPYVVTFVDIDVQITGERSASARFSATLTSRDPNTEERDVDAREVDVRLQRTDNWRISRIVFIETLEKPVP